MDDTPILVLASASLARRQMLEAAGLSFDVARANIDESSIREQILETDPRPNPVSIAKTLARAKAKAVGQEHPGALVIGADQLLVCDRTIFAKAADLQDARQTLLKLRAHTHRLVSAVALADGPAVTWTAVDSAELTMRAFSEAFLDAYLRRAGASVMSSVGAYALEGLGVQLFERISGDYFTILGMPLLPLLAELRRRDVLSS